MSCVYLRDSHPGKFSPDGRAVFGCDLHELCVQNTIPADNNGHKYAVCALCKDRLTLDSPKLAADYVDPLRVYTRHKRPTDALRGMLAGGPAFLVCGGPSAKQLPLAAALQQPAVWSLAVNNMAGYYRPNAFVHSDPPSKFHNGIWQDNGVMKFIPEVKLDRKRGALRQKLADGTFAQIDKRTRDMPNVWGFERRSWIKPDDSFFLEPSASWGNNNDGVRRTGGRKTSCTPLLGLRILYYLGARRIYLVGVDFWMDPAAGKYDNYAFGEERDAGACQTNNDQYAVVNEWLCTMQDSGVFRRFGLEIYNCNPTSALRAFEHVSFDDAVADARRDHPAGPPYDTKGWYVK